MHLADAESVADHAGVVQQLSADKLQTRLGEFLEDGEVVLVLRPHVDELAHRRALLENREFVVPTAAPDGDEAPTVVVEVQKLAENALQRLPRLELPQVLQRVVLLLPEVPYRLQE